MQCRFESCRGHFGRTAIGAVSRLENGWACKPWGFDSLSFRSGVVERQDARLLIVRRRFESCRRSWDIHVGGRCPWRHGSLISSRAWFDSRASDLSCPRGRAVMTPGSQPGRRGFDSRRGYCTTHLPVGEHGHPAGFGSRRPLVRLQPGRLRGRGVAVLASLMSSRPRVRIPPALLADVAQTCRALGCPPRGRRFESGHPRAWWSWCNGSIRGRDPRGTGSNPVDRPLMRTLSTGELRGP